MPRTSTRAEFDPANWSDGPRESSAEVNRPPARRDPANPIADAASPENPAAAAKNPPAPAAAPKTPAASPPVSAEIPIAAAMVIIFAPVLPKTFDSQPIMLFDQS